MDSLRHDFTISLKNKLKITMKQWRVALYSPAREKHILATQVLCLVCTVSVQLPK
jgi:hypothetical protein